MTTGTIEAPAAPAANAAPATTPAPAAAPAAKAPETPAAPAPEAAKPAVETPKAKEDGTILGGESPKADKKPGEAKPGEQKQGAPEKYADFKLPDGMTLDAATVDKFKATAKEMNLSQDGAQKFVDLQTQYAKAQQDSVLAGFQKQVADWKAQSTALFQGADVAKEFGVASKAVERFGTPALRQLLNESGLGNHPELVRFFHNVGKRVSEDSPVEGRRAGGDSKSDADVLYPGMKKK